MSLRVLIIDDDADIRFLMGIVLKDAGLDVVTAESGREALMAMEQGPAFDLVLADIAMPDMDGRAFAAEARRRWPDRPSIAFMTADDEVTLDEPAAHMLAKPFDIARLPDQLRALAVPQSP